MITLEQTCETPVDAFLREVGAAWDAKVAVRSSASQPTGFCTRRQRAAHMSNYFTLLMSIMSIDVHCQGPGCISLPWRASVVNSGREPKREQQSHATQLRRTTTSASTQLSNRAAVSAPA